jgi:hypothetical protein
MIFHFWLRWFVTASNTPRAISTPSPSGAPISMASISCLPIRREHIPCDWKAPQLGQQILKFERIEAISDPRRELIEDLWPGGFGTVIVEKIIEGQLHGKVRFDWRAQGLTCQIALPLA